MSRVLFVAVVLIALLAGAHAQDFEVSSKERETTQQRAATPVLGDGASGGSRMDSCCVCPCAPRRDAAPCAAVVLRCDSLLRLRCCVRSLLFAAAPLDRCSCRAPLLFARLSLLWRPPSWPSTPRRHSSRWDRWLATSHLPSRASLRSIRLRAMWPSLRLERRTPPRGTVPRTSLCCATAVMCSASMVTARARRASRVPLLSELTRPSALPNPLRSSTLPWMP